MVNVKYIHFLLLLCAMSTSVLISMVANAGQLHFQLSQKRIELGQMLKGKLVAVDMSATLSDINLSPLLSNFAINSYPGELNANERQRYPQSNVQVLDLELYPRHTGELNIPPVSLDDVESHSHIVNVDKAKELEGQIAIDTQVSAHRAWQRQQIIITATMTSPQSFVALETESYNPTGFEVLPVKLQKQSVQTSHGQRTRIDAVWTLFPLLAGNYRLDLPLLGYRHNGRIQRHFALPRVNLNVSQLPAYIPPNMPVAMVTITSHISETGLLIPGDLYYWIITLSANGTLPYWLPPVLHSIHNSNNIEFLPVQSKRELHFTEGRIHATVVHKLPFIVHSSGRIHLPMLKLQYFDPVEGRIQSLHYQLGQRWAMSGLALTLLVLALCLTFFLLLLKAYRGIHNRVHQKREIRFSLDHLQQADSAMDVIYGLRRYAAANGWPANICLFDFISIWRQHYVLPQNLISAILGLSKCAYSDKTTQQSLVEFRAVIINHLRKPKRV